ncbi:MAG TPA: NAD(P)/FAD-dependent oxidoreductase [Streptosporangiaceae bacterium]|jgi:dihydrolipoamide dehydrogenase|nr:NAD(P)/FAD-dependent oxidoreductase [Streptosporangiaceae bacterium]
MSVVQEYDVVVIGAGPTGENVADRAVKKGLTAAIVESELVGGECSYWACMPSKALLRPVAAVDDARHVEGVGGAALEAAGVLDRRDGFASHWQDDGQVKWLDGAHIGLHRGQGRLTGPKTVSVNGTELRARHAVAIATGTAAMIPPVPGLAEAKPWTSREVTSAQEAPPRLAIIGGGVVGCEMATAWQALGAQVTLIVRGRLLASTEEFAGQLVTDGLRQAGVDVRLNVSATGVSRPDAGGPVTLELDDGTTVEADEVLAAAGRTPRTGDIGLETVGLEPGSWLDDVDGSLRVKAVDGGWLYAAGDVNHLALLTHMGKYQARVCGDAIAARAAGREPATTAWADQSAVPQVIFTQPEVASVGPTADQARAAGRNIRVADYNLGAVAGSKLFADGYTGQARMVVDEDRHTMIGATLAGPGVGELIHAATVAVAGQVPLDQLWHAVPSYPTMSEIWLRLLETYGL